MPARCRRSAVSVPSRPIGAHTRTRSSVALAPVIAQGVGGAHVAWNTGEDALEFRQCLADVHAVWTETKLADARFVAAGPLLHDGECASYSAVRFEEPQQYNGVRQVADVERRRHPGADNAVLRDDDDSGD